METELSGQVSLKGIGISYTFKVGEGKKTGSFVGNDMGTIVGKKLHLKLTSQAKVNVKGDDSSIGAANADAEVEITQKAYVKAVAETETIISTLEFKLENSTAEYTIVTIDKKTEEVLSRTTKQLKAPEAIWENIDGKIEKNEGWGLPAHEWKDPPQGRKIGVGPGDWAIYKLSSNVIGLTNISFLEWRIIRANHNTGHVLLAITTERVNGDKETNLIDYDIYTGEGEIMGLIVPSMLNVSDALYGIGRVINVSNIDLGGRIREVVQIIYQNTKTQVNAIYDRRSGILLELNATSPRGTLKMEILDSSIHHPTIEELQEKIAKLSNELNKSQGFISELKDQLENAHVQISDLVKKLDAETKKRIEYENKIKHLEAYISSIENLLYKLKLIVIIITIILISAITILSILYIKRKGEDAKQR